MALSDHRENNHDAVTLRRRLECISLTPFLSALLLADVGHQSLAVQWIHTAVERDLALVLAHVGAGVGLGNLLIGVPGSGAAELPGGHELVALTLDGVDARWELGHLGAVTLREGWPAVARGRGPDVDPHILPRVPAASATWERGKNHKHNGQPFPIQGTFPPFCIPCSLFPVLHSIHEPGRAPHHHGPLRPVHGPRQGVHQRGVGAACLEQLDHGAKVRTQRL